MSGKITTNKTLLTLILLMIAGTNFVAMINTTAVTILLPVFMKQFEVDMILTQWVVTAYILANCTIAPIVGFISDRMGIKRTFLLAVSGFAIFTFLLGCSGTIYIVIGLRIFQGLFGGMLMPLTQSMIYQLFPSHKQAQAISIWATTNLIAPTIAPSLAGIISDLLSWRWIFLLEVPILIIVLAAAMKLIPKQQPRSVEQHAFDFTGLVLSVCGSVALLLAFSNITVWGLCSVPVIALTVGGLGALSLFFYLENKKEHPLLHVKVFGYEGFLSSVILLCVGSILINASNNIFPVFLQDVQGFSTTQAAFIMLPGPLFIMFLVPLMGKYYDSIGPQRMLYGIMTFGILACIALGSIHMETTIPFIIFALILRDIGAGTLNMPATNMGMQAVPMVYATHAAAVTSWARQCVISLTIGLANTFQTARTSYYQNILSVQEEGMRYAQSYSMAMDDLFHVLILFFIIGFVAVYFSKSRNVQT